MTTNVMTDVEQYREPAYEIDPIFINRWSPRSFSNKAVSDDDLFSIFEAARWAPSASNEQPWRFLIARTQEDRKKFYDFILPGNREWCEKAPVLAVMLSKTTRSNGGHNRAHAFDTGTAWGYLALEASRKGLVTHAMGGFDPEQAREVLNVPDEYELHAVVAIGYQAEKEELPENLQSREQPSIRRPLEESLFEGDFGDSAK